MPPSSHILHLSRDHFHRALGQGLWCRSFSSTVLTSMCIDNTVVITIFEINIPYKNFTSTMFKRLFSITSKQIRVKEPSPNFLQKRFISMSKLRNGTELGSVVRRQTRAAPLPRVVLSDADTLTISHYLVLKQLSITMFL